MCSSRRNVCRMGIVRAGSLFSRRQSDASALWLDDGGAPVDRSWCSFEREIRGFCGVDCGSVETFASWACLLEFAVQLRTVNISDARSTLSISSALHIWYRSIAARQTVIDSRVSFQPRIGWPWSIGTSLIYAACREPAARVGRCQLGRLPKISTPVEKTVESPGFRACCRRFNPIILGFPGRRILETRSQLRFSPVINVTIL